MDKEITIHGYVLTRTYPYKGRTLLGSEILTEMYDNAELDRDGSVLNESEYQRFMSYVGSNRTDLGTSQELSG